MRFFKEEGKKILGEVFFIFPQRVKSIPQEGVKLGVGPAAAVAESQVGF